MIDPYEQPTPPASMDERTPPTDGDRLRMFVSLATQHEALIEALDTASTATMAEPATAAERIDHTRRKVRVASVRKFILDLNDNTHLAKVFASAQMCVSGTAPRMTDYIQGLHGELNRVRTISDVEYVLGDDEAVDDLDIVKDVVYGNLLHGDYAKWWRTEQRKRTGWEVSSLLFWLSDAEALILASRDMVIDGVRGGFLTLR